MEDLREHVYKTWFHCSVNLLTTYVTVSEEEIRVLDLLNSLSVFTFYTDICQP